MEPRRAGVTGFSLLLGLIACGGKTERISTGDPPRDAGNDEVLDMDATLSCDELTTAAHAELRALVDANSGCAADEDCTLVNVSGRCLEACLIVVNASNADALEQGVSDWCQPFTDQGCDPIQVPCITGPVACRNGVCTLESP